MPAAGERGRVTGDDLISSLFEAMHDLHFLRDSLEGGDFCLALANEMMPCRVGLVHAYDINKRNFIVACAAGPGAEGLLTRRVPDQDALLLTALRSRKSVVVPDAAKAGAPGLERYQLIGGAKSVIVTPIMFGARALAALELVDPLDGHPFTEDEGHAMNYIAEQFAEFIGSHGLVLETDKILAHHAQNAQQPGHHP
jgi:GAF domain-containing protein